MSEARWTARAARVRHPAAARAAALASVAAVAGTLAAGAWFARFGLPVAAALALAAMLLRRGRALAVDHISLRDKALRVEAGDATALAVPVDEVTAGWVVPRAEGAEVELARRGGATVELAVEGTAEANEVLGALGFDARRRSLRVRLGRSWDGPLRAFGVLVFGGLQTLPLLALFAAWLHLGSAARSLLFSAVALGAYVSASRALGPPELTIGADGITLQRGFRPRFLPYRLLRWIERDGDDIVLLLADDQRIRVSPTSRDARRDDMVVERVRSAAERARSGSGSAALALLDRNGRSVRDWRESVATLHRAEAYRGHAVSVEELEAVLADPGASAERRIAAAVALAAQDRDAARTRVRVSLDACADPLLRGAVESALRGEIDDEAMELAADESRDVAELRRGLGV